VRRSWEGVVTPLPLDLGTFNRCNRRTEVIILVLLHKAGVQEVFAEEIIGNCLVAAEKVSLIIVLSFQLATRKVLRGADETVWDGGRNTKTRRNKEGEDYDEETESV